MKIAFIGQKGIPAVWGGVEEHVEQLAIRLSARGHEVTVYSRPWYSEEKKDYGQNLNLVLAPSLNTKHLDAFSHSFTSSMHSIFNRFDVIHYHAIGPSFFSWLPKVSKAKVLATIHRFDYEAEKWGKLASNFLKFSEKIALNVPDQTIVVAKHQKEYYQSMGKSVVYIPNGVVLPKKAKAKVITNKHSLSGDDYILSMGRLSPEKRVDLLIDAFNSLETDLKLVIAGGSSATDDYVGQLHQKAAGNKNIIFTGYVKGEEKEELLSNAKAFVIPSALEGLPIALLEAMSYGLSCLASDIAPHKEVITENQNGFLFASGSAEDLKEKLLRMMQADGKDLTGIRQSAVQTVKEEYNWDIIVDEMEALYQKILNID